MEAHNGVTRRDFLRLAGVGLGAWFLPAPLRYKEPLYEPRAFAIWPSLRLLEFPQPFQSILNQAPRSELDAEGFLTLLDKAGQPLGKVPLARTQWNIERDQKWDRLYANVPWGIVLHWYGDRKGFDRTVAGFLRGFDSLREVDGEKLRTSAHFLVGGATPTPEGEPGEEAVGILQTQLPDKDGTPFVASHLRPLNYEAHLAKEQYFVRAYYKLAKTEPGVHSLLQDMYDGPQLEPNMRTIAIEICGADFDDPQSAPSGQKIANTLSLVWALMKQYGIPASSILGHHEIQLGKADPGKKLMATMRCLIGLKALTDPDARMKDLVFGQFFQALNDSNQAIRSYFKFVRDYHVMVSNKKIGAEWEAESKFWSIYEALP